MPRAALPSTVSDLSAESGVFLRDVLKGLGRTPKQLPCKYFYDQRGSELFDQICELDEYYLTRTELAIMRAHAAEMAVRIGPRCLLIEPGSGSSRKTRVLLGHLEEVAAYVPVDISGEHMTRWAEALAADFPGLSVVPVHADFSAEFSLPEVPSARRSVVYFPGSTIGNFQPNAAVSLIERMARLVGTHGGLLIGIDRKKDTAVLEAAYNDESGVTRAFNLNILHRIQNELDAEIEVDQFDHRAFYNETEGRIEIHLVSRVDQVIRLDGTEFELAAGETIHTENSYKYDLADFDRITFRGGFERQAIWSDPKAYFSVLYLTVR
ncbi:MAG: L-histidine N(alpha)-methyltransferase [Planctomycetota bacterium]|jgi:dimethylhistidine N-methyltransferase